MRAERTLCSACGFENEASARFCGGCARPLTRMQPGSDRSAPALTSVTPAHLAERILASRGAMEGERKLVTVMFVDVLGSLELIAGRDPEHAQTILDALLREMIGAVHRYEGTVNQVLGDGLMAIFGAPIAHEDHAVRAACAALAIQHTVRQARSGIWRDVDVAAEVRIGLNSGMVVIKAIENDLSIDYRAIGTTTHLASRMEQIALPGTTRLTRETLRLAEGMIDAEPLGRIAVKGIAEPVEVYELRRLKPGATRFRARMARGLTPLYGRSDEMATLLSALREAALGSPKAAALYGEPGVGKSRLCYEVTRDEAARAFRVLEVAALSYEKGTPYAAVVAMLRQYFGMTELESGAELLQRLQVGLAPLAPLQGEYLPILQGLLDIPGTNALWQGLDPGLRKLRVFEVMRAIIQAMCERQPVMLVCEDLHWFDTESLEFVDGLVREPPSRALFMVLTAREHSAAWTDVDVVALHLLPLAPHLTDVMLREFLGDAPELNGLRTLLTSRTYGNPFFIEETVRSVVESGALIGAPGRYGLRESGPQIDIPPTAEALIAARIDGLTPAVKALVQTAAVVGAEMTLELLQRVSGLQTDLFRERLAAARNAGLMFEIQLFPSPMCGFRHALTHEVAYGSLLQPQRHALHARVVEVLEDLHRDRLAEQVERLADHAFRGELWDKCVRYHIMAAARAATRFANHEAVQMLDRGLSAVEHLPSGRARSEAEIDLRLAGLAALLPLGEHERILRTLFEAEALSAAIGDPRRLAAVHSQASAALWMAGQHERALDSAKRALAMAEEHKQFGLRLTARGGLVQAHHALGQFELCIEVGRSVIQELSGELERKRFGWAVYPTVLCASFVGSALTLMGRFDAAQRELERGIAVADATRHPLSRALVMHELGTLLYLQGRASDALRVFESALQVAREGEVFTMFAPLAGWRAAALTALGRADEAIDTAEEVIGTRTARVAGHYAKYFLLNGVAAAYARAGRRDDALAAAQDAVEATSATREYAHLGHALWRLADIQAGLGPDFTGAAERSYRAALAEAAARGMRPLAAACHDGLGRLYEIRGERSAAQKELQRGAELYAELGLRPTAATST